MKKTVKSLFSKITIILLYFKHNLILLTAFENESFNLIQTF